MTPHPLYKVLPVSGKAAATTPCKKFVAHDGIECITVKCLPANNMIAVCVAVCWQFIKAKIALLIFVFSLDCMGILKITSYDAKQRRSRKMAASRSASRAQTASNGADASAHSTSNANAAVEAQCETTTSTSTRIYFRYVLIHKMAKAFVILLTSFLARTFGMKCKMFGSKSKLAHRRLDAVSGHSVCMQVV